MYRSSTKRRAQRQDPENSTAVLSASFLWNTWAVRSPAPTSWRLIILSTGFRSRSQSQDCQGFQVLHQHLAPSISMASGQTTHSLIAPGTPTQGKGYHLIGSGAILSEAITHAFFTTKVASSHTSALTLKLYLVCHVWKKLCKEVESGLVNFHTGTEQTWTFRVLMSICEERIHKEA